MPPSGLYSTHNIDLGAGVVVFVQHDRQAEAFHNFLNFIYIEKNHTPALNSSIKTSFEWVLQYSNVGQSTKSKFVFGWNLAFQTITESLNDLSGLSGLIYFERPEAQSRSYSNFTWRQRKNPKHANLKNAAKEAAECLVWLQIKQSFDIE